MVYPYIAYGDARLRRAADPRDDHHYDDDNGYRGDDRSSGSQDYGHPGGDAWRGPGRSTARGREMSYGAAWPPAAYDPSRFRTSAYPRDGYGSGGAYGDDYDRRAATSEQDRPWWDRASDEVRSWFGDDDAERRRERDQSHRGRGPRGYRRSDARISEDAHDRLTEDARLDASDIEVKVEDGEVTLDGAVRSRPDKHRAEAICEDISGVTHVQNNLRVSRPDESSSFADRA